MTLPSVLEKRLSENAWMWLVRCLPRDGVLEFEFAQVNRVGKGEDDGPRVERGHDLDNVLGERVLKRVSMTKAGHRTTPTFNVLRPKRAVGWTWLMMSTKFVSGGPS